LKSYRFLGSIICFSIYACLCNTYAQSAASSSSSVSKIILKQDILGHGFDIREIDPKSWGSSSKGTILIQGPVNQEEINSKTETAFHFITTPYEYERELLETDTLNNLYRAYKSNAYYKPLDQDGRSDQLFVYTEKKKPLYKKRLNTSKARILDSALIADFSRLGRDITAEGFIHRYGTHYAQEVTYGGIFLRRNLIKVDDFIYSPYDKENFKKKLITDIEFVHTKIEDTDPYINSGNSTSFTVGGNTDALWPSSWETTVAEQPQPIAVVLKSYTSLLRNTPLVDIEDKAIKIHLLDSMIQQTMEHTRGEIQEETLSTFYKKYSLRFQQRITSIVKKSTGKDEENLTEYTGDIFFGGFSKDDAILETQPLIQYGGLSLETLITDEEVIVDQNLIVTIKPEDIEYGYVSVWDDTKKLFKSEDRKTLRVSGPEKNKIRYKEALVRKVNKTIEIETVDKDLFELNYSLELVKEKKLIQNLTTSYNYVLDTELVAAATTGDIERLGALFKQNGNPQSSGIIKAIISNKQPNKVLNFVLDKGVIPTTDDLDLLFDPDNYDEQKALILLERGAKPKNNMIYKAVAYKSDRVIYALFREGATPKNNDLAFALKRNHYPTVKALMSEEYDEFVAGKNELLLAAENNDDKLAAKFIELGSTADAYILEKALDFDNPQLKRVITAVTEPNADVLELAAAKNDTGLFDYFIRKNAKIETNVAAELATDNDNTEILDLALKNGGEATEALSYAIEKDNKSAIEISLKNNAKPDAAFDYAAEKEDDALFSALLTKYEGTPSIALEAAVKEDRLPYVEQVITLKPKDINTTDVVALAVSIESLSMVKLLTENNADPNQGLGEAVNKENLEITEYLIDQGAQSTAPEIIKEAVKRENITLSKVLVEKGNADVNDAIVEAAETENVAITTYLLDKGATADKAIKTAMETNNEELILIMLDTNPALDPSFVSTAARKGNLNVLKVLLDRGIDPSEAVADALRYRKTEALELLLNQEVTLSYDLLEIAISYNYPQGVKLLLEQGIEPNAPFIDGRYPLHLLMTAYEETDSAILSTLLEGGADINIQNKAGETPLHLATRQGIKNADLIKKLLVQGASLDTLTKDGRSIQDYAPDKATRNILKKFRKEQRF